MIPHDVSRGRILFPDFQMVLNAMNECCKLVQCADTRHGADAGGER